MTDRDRLVRILEDTISSSEAARVKFGDSLRVSDLKKILKLIKQEKPFQMPDPPRIPTKKC